MSLKNFQSTGRVSRMKPKQMVKLLKDEYPEYSGITFKQIKNEDMEQELLNMELRLMVKGYKYGILYAKEGQVEEEKMFCNNDPSPDFTEFLEFLADKIELKGWEAYNGGLDVQQGMTGKHSYFTKFKDYSIMFHVSTELPFTEGDPQQIERKRHLGNDIVVIVFQEGDTPFNPTCVHSYFNHVFFVVRKEPNNEGKTMYR
jgi:RAP1 GTPase activating protein 1